MSNESELENDPVRIWIESEGICDSHLILLGNAAVSLMKSMKGRGPVTVEGIRYEISEKFFKAAGVVLVLEL